MLTVFENEIAECGS